MSPTDTPSAFAQPDPSYPKFVVTLAAQGGCAGRQPLCSFWMWQGCRWGVISLARGPSSILEAVHTTVSSFHRKPRPHLHLPQQHTLPPPSPKPSAPLQTTPCAGRKAASVPTGDAAGALPPAVGGGQGPHAAGVGSPAPDPRVRTMTDARGVRYACSLVDLEAATAAQKEHELQLAVGSWVRSCGGAAGAQGRGWTLCVGRCSTSRRLLAGEGLDRRRYVGHTTCMQPTPASVMPAPQAAPTAKTPFELLEAMCEQRGPGRDVAAVHLL